MTSRPADRRIIAIDGPAASGKSSVARDLARRLGFIYVNSGAMYRAITWHVLQSGLRPDDRAGIEELVRRAHLETGLCDHESCMSIDGSDPAPHLRDERVNQGVSLVSSIPLVREILVEKMRAYAVEHDVVMEGRDIGSVVFPKTPFKFYIDAAPEIRSRRRADQGQTDQIAARDRADSSRSASPLTVAEDARVIDSSRLSIAEVVEQIVAALQTQNFPLTERRF